MIKMRTGCDIKLLFDTEHRRTKEEYSSQIKELCECGFYYYNFDFGTGRKDAPIYSDDYIKWAYDIREALEENNAGCAIAHEPCFFRFTLTDEEKEIQRRVIEVCSVIGAEWLIMHPIDEDGSGDRAHMKRLAEKNYEHFSKYSDMLEKYKVGMAVENLSNVFKLNYNGLKRQYGDNPYDIIELIDRIGNEDIQMCVDIGHLNTMGLFHIGDTIRDIGPRLKALHIHDNDGLKDQHYLPFMGTIDWADFIKALKSIDYRGVFMYEADHIPSKYPRELRKSWLRLKYDIAQYIVNL